MPIGLEPERQGSFDHSFFNFIGKLEEEIFLNLEDGPCRITDPQKWISTILTISSTNPTGQGRSEKGKNENSLDKRLVLG